MKKITQSIQLIANQPYISEIKEDGEVVSIPLTDFLKSGKQIGVVEITDARTMAQNRALHLFLARLAKILNDGGLNMYKVLYPEQDIKIDKAFEYAIKTHPKLRDFFERMRSYIAENKKEFDWDMDSVKEYIWRPIQIAITGKKSTTMLSKKDDIDSIYNNIAKSFAEDFGVDVGEFPNWESLVQGGAR